MCFWPCCNVNINLRRYYNAVEPPVVEWSKTIGDGGVIDECFFDSSENAYVRVNNGLDGYQIAKVTPAGVTAWIIERGDHPLYAVDPSGNTYFFQDNGGNSANPYLFKYNTAGTLVWQVADTYSLTDAQSLGITSNVLCCTGNFVPATAPDFKDRAHRRSLVDGSLLSNSILITHDGGSSTQSNPLWETNSGEYIVSVLPSPTNAGREIFQFDALGEPVAINGGGEYPWWQIGSSQFSGSREVLAVSGTDVKLYRATREEIGAAFDFPNEAGLFRDLLRADRQSWTIGTSWTSSFGGHIRNLTSPIHLDDIFLQVNDVFGGGLVIVEDKEAFTEPFLENFYPRGLEPYSDGASVMYGDLNEVGSGIGSRFVKFTAAGAIVFLSTTGSLGVFRVSTDDTLYTFGSVE